MSVAPGVVIDEQHLLPRLSAVGGLEDAALRIRAPQVSDARDIHDVGIGRMNHDAADVAGLLEAHVAPRPAAVHRLVDAVAPRRALPVVGFAGAGPDDVRVRWRDGEIADRHHRVDAVEDRHPRRALVRALEDPAAGRADVDGVRGAGHPRHREIVDPSTGVGRTDAAEFQTAERRRLDRRRRRVPCRLRRQACRIAPRIGAPTAPGATVRPR